MRDVNAVKKASADTSRLSTHFSRAVELFWPDKVAEMKSLLLQTPDDPKSAALKSSSKYEEIVSFRCLVSGAICVWQECWNLLQTCKRKSVTQESYIDQETYTPIEKMTVSLDNLKTDLIRIIDKRHYRQAALTVFTLQSIYLYLQAQRMITFIKNPRLLGILTDIPKDPPTHTGLLLTTPVERLQDTNMQLITNFRIHQRDNIEDFLLHLEGYFQPNMKEALDKKSWLVCEQGRQRASSLFSSEYK